MVPADETRRGAPDDGRHPGDRGLRGGAGALARPEKLGEMPGADLAAGELVPLGLPMRLEADRAGVAVALQRRNLSLPVNAHLPDRSPGHVAAVDRAILGVHVRDARPGKPVV